MSKTENSKRTLGLEDAHLKAATVVSIIVALVVFVWQVASWAQEDAVWKNNIERDVTQLNEKIVGKSPKGWHRWEMRQFVSRLRASNPNLKIPEVDDIPVSP